MITETVNAENLTATDLTAQRSILRDRIVTAVTTLSVRTLRVRRADICAHLANTHQDVIYRSKLIDHALQDLRKTGRLIYTGEYGWAVRW